MTARLKAICSLIEHTHSFIDVGCDHGYVVKYVYDRKLADKITACDISLRSLGKARALLGDGTGVEFVCADGATAACGYETVLVSGLGGIETAAILKDCTPHTVILSPQSHVRDVRDLLFARGYKITYDKVVKDKKKFYDVIKAVKSDEAILAEADPLRMEFGVFYDGDGNEALYERLENMLNALAQYPPTAENKLKADAIKEVLRCRLR